MLPLPASLGNHHSVVGAYECLFVLFVHWCIPFYVPHMNEVIRSLTFLPDLRHLACGSQDRFVPAKGPCAHPLHSEMICQNDLRGHEVRQVSQPLPFTFGQSCSTIVSGISSDFECHFVST